MLSPFFTLQSNSLKILLIFSYYSFFQKKESVEIVQLALNMAGLFLREVTAVVDELIVKPTMIVGEESQNMLQLIGQSIFML